MFSPGVIYLKNLCVQFWEQREPEHPTDVVPFSLHEQDKQLIRDNMVEAVLAAPVPIRLLPRVNPMPIQDIVFRLDDIVI